MRLAFAAALTLGFLSFAAQAGSKTDRDRIMPQPRPASDTQSITDSPVADITPQPRPYTLRVGDAATTTKPAAPAPAPTFSTPAAPAPETDVADATDDSDATGAGAPTPAPRPVQTAANNASPALHVLSDADVARYRRIFADERTGNFKEAEALTAQLQDTSLIGYVRAEYLLSPHSGHIASHKLISWMRSYSTLPIAERIRTLAKLRAGRHHHVPYIPAAHYRGGGYEDYDPTEKPIRSAAGKRALRRIDSAIRIDKPERADQILQELIAQHDLPIEDIARLARRICMSYLIENAPAPALALATAAAAGGGNDAAPRLDWCAGLAAYQLGQFDVAASHFETLSSHASMPDTILAGAYFWAARSYLRAGTPAPVAELLQKAAAKEPTFYGLLAESLLGQDPQTDFQDPVPNPDTLRQALHAPATRRAVALWQVNPNAYASYISEELNRGFGNAGNMGLDVAYAWIAHQIGAPNIEMRASETATANGKRLTGLFPRPPYTPNGGYTIDSALVLAFARIESRFQTKVVSPAGAVGLMQLMPRTARLIGGSRATSHALRNPAYNLSLGQRYIARMLDYYDGNLIKMAAAYNAGPGKVNDWASSFTGGKNDALLFIETMHAPETRSYVKKVLTYYWLYHRSGGKAAPSLMEAARGEWPEYHPPKQSAPAAPPPDEDEEDADDLPVS